MLVYSDLFGSRDGISQSFKYQGKLRKVDALILYAGSMDLIPLTLFIVYVIQIMDALKEKEVPLDIINSEVRTELKSLRKKPRRTRKENERNFRYFTPVEVYNGNLNQCDS
jgi:hypothetical protein